MHFSLLHCIGHLRRGPAPAAGLLAAGLLASCEPPPPAPARLLMADGFEAAALAPPYTAEQAHTGRQALKVGQEAEFATLYKGTWAGLGQRRHLRLRLWAWLPAAQQRGITLTAVASRPAGPQTLHWQAFNLAQVLRHYRRWVPTTFFVSLPRGLQPTDEVTFYLWVPPSEFGPVYVDDFSLEHLD